MIQADQAPITVTSQVPFLMDTDVLIVGGGTTGPFAAIAAGRQGKRVVLVERFGSLGGLLTLGLNTKPSGSLSGGIPREVWDLARSVGAAGPDFRAQLHEGEIDIACPCDPELMKMILTRLCVEAGVRILFECVVTDAIVEDGRVRGAILEAKGGKRYITAKTVIDCSADGDFAASAGAPFVIGTGGETPAMQPVSMYFTMDNCDIEKLASWAREHPEIVPDTNYPEDVSYGLYLQGFHSAVRAFKERTGIHLVRENIALKTANGRMYVNATRVLGKDGLNPFDVSDATVECYRQIDGYAQFLREDIPGFENAIIGQISPILGVRETRHIQGEYVLTGHDVVDGTCFDDSIAADASAFDIHDVKGGDVDFQSVPPYEIPYRSLVPLGVEQLLVAGRCISVDHKAHGRTRNMPACMATGQAAGIAAALAVDSNTTVRDLDVGRIQKVLTDLKMPIKAQQII